MLNIFGKNYGPNFRTILFCRHLYHRHILGLYDGTNDNLLSHILLIFKYYTYISRQKRILNRDNLIVNLIKAKKREEQISLVTSSKREVYIYIYIYINKRKMVRRRQHVASNLIIHCEKHTGWVRRRFFFYCLYVCLDIFIFVYFFSCFAAFSSN